MGVVWRTGSLNILRVCTGGCLVDCFASMRSMVLRSLRHLVAFSCWRRCAASVHVSRPGLLLYKLWIRYHSVHKRNSVYILVSFSPLNRGEWFGLAPYSHFKQLLVLSYAVEWLPSDNPLDAENSMCLCQELSNREFSSLRTYTWLPSTS